MSYKNQLEYHDLKLKYLDELIIKISEREKYIKYKNYIVGMNSIIYKALGVENLKRGYGLFIYMRDNIKYKYKIRFIVPVSP